MSFLCSSVLLGKVRVVKTLTARRQLKYSVTGVLCCFLDIPFFYFQICASSHFLQNGRDTLSMGRVRPGWPKGQPDPTLKGPGSGQIFCALAWPA